jgi:transcription antitermination factor NusG
LVCLGGGLKRGDEVTIKTGPLLNFSGVFDHRINNTERVEILLTAVSFKGRVVIDRAFIEKVEVAA